jgi:hypothetical protein
MGKKTGRPRGRPKGAKNKRTAEREAAMRNTAANIEGTVNGAFLGDALAFLTSIYKDPAKPENLRIDATKVAIRFERAPLAPRKEASKTDVVPLAERLRAYAAEAATQKSGAKVVDLRKPAEQT